MSAPILVAVDIGSGITKVKSQDAEAEFPSISGPPLPEVFALKKDPGAYVQFGGKDFCVGDRALSAVRPADIIDSRTDQWFESDGYRALLYAALAKVLPGGYTGRVALCTGLPIGFYADAKDKLVSRLVGEHRFTVGGKAYKVVIRRPHCWVLPQALGLYLKHLGSERMEEDGRRGYIDVGTYTCGWVAVEKFEVLQWATGGIRMGVGDVKQSLADYLQSTYGLYATRSTVESALETGKVRVGSETVDLTDAIDGIAMKCSEPMRDALRKGWGPAKESSIWVGGGGGRLLYPAIKTVFPHAQLLATSTPHLAIVEGYYNWVRTKIRIAASAA